MSERKAEAANVAEEERRRLNRWIDTAITVADEYRSRGNHARAKEVDELASYLRERSARVRAGGK